MATRLEKPLRVVEAMAMQVLILTQLQIQTLCLQQIHQILVVQKLDVQILFIVIMIPPPVLTMGVVMD